MKKWLIEVEYQSTWYVSILNDESHTHEECLSTLEDARRRTGLNLDDTYRLRHVETDEIRPARL